MSAMFLKCSLDIIAALPYAFPSTQSLYCSNGSLFIPEEFDWGRGSSAGVVELVLTKVKFDGEQGV
jgi:hypothetical protein